jgi:DNA-binding transcriptional MerR regulator
MEALGIGQLAKRGGVGIDTVRYYERSGLLTPRTRLASGYRRYGDTELARLRFIRRAQGLGFTLKEIKQLLALSAQRDVTLAVPVMLVAMGDWRESCRWAIRSKTPRPRRFGPSRRSVCAW